MARCHHRRMMMRVPRCTACAARDTYWAPGEVASNLDPQTRELTTKPTTKPPNPGTDHLPIGSDQGNQNTLPAAVDNKSRTQPLPSQPPSPRCLRNPSKIGDSIVKRSVNQRSARRSKLHACGQQCVRVNMHDSVQVRVRTGA